MQGDWPPVRKAVMVAAPHTSNWDGVWMLAAAGFYQVKLSWMGKKSLVDHPLGGIVRWLGCVPVDRASAGDVAQQSAEAFGKTEQMVLAIAPEGTRSLTKTWKSGFYRIAVAAKVPLILSVLDYRHRTIRIDGAFEPTGDYETDLPKIQAGYTGAGGRHDGRFAAGSTGKETPEDKG